MADRGSTAFANPDQYQTIAQVKQAMRAVHFEGSDMIIAVDFTISNQDNGRHSFGGKSLHAFEPGTTENPYTTVMRIICNTLQYDDDGRIHAYGFGDYLAKGDCLLGFARGDGTLAGLESVVGRYKQLVQSVKLYAPTSFAPAIYKAMQVVRESGGNYHMLLIIGDGEVTKGASWDETRAALVAASEYPLSVIMIGVGDGPWDKMVELDDGLRSMGQRFDNFQFVQFTALAAELHAKGLGKEAWDAQFAMHALMEIPAQYKYITEHGLIGRVPGTPAPVVRIHDPPV